VEILDSPRGLLRFHLNRPLATFLTVVMMMGIILPKHIWENIMKEQGVSQPTEVLIDKPIGSGFFKFGHHKRDQELLLMANKEHFSPPRIEELLITMVPSIDGIMGRLETKEIDFAINSLSPSQANRLKKFKHLSVVETDDIGYIKIDPFLAKMPWRDIELRRALHHTIDKEFVVNTLWEGAGILGKNTLIPPANKFWYNPNLPEVKFDLDKARKILKDAGYGWDDEGRLLYPDPNDPNYRKRIDRVIAPR
jgi:peptide/nickel transport system substrate-binding protein